MGSKPTSRPNLFLLYLRLTVSREPIAPLSSLTLAVAPATPANLFVGTSGWAYPTWKPDFYPAKTPAKKFLNFYASQLNSVEVNYTFRTLPTPIQLATWIAATPEIFRFTFKAPQRITHFKRLRDCADDVAQLLTVLEPVRKAGRLGLILFQLPPNFKVDPNEAPSRLATFLKLPPFRGQNAPHIAFEFRHQSFFAEATYATLRQHNAALCIADSDDLTTPEVHTANTHTCFRLRRNGGYSTAEISAVARRLSKLTQQRTTYVYFKHEDEPTGALNASALLQAAVKKAQS